MNLPLPEAQSPQKWNWWNFAIAIAALFACGTLVFNVVDAFGPPFRRPAIACNATQWNIGECDASTTLEHEFTVRNVGGKPLTINRILVSCDCTRVQPIRFPHEIAPQESLTFGTILDPSGLSGSIKRQVIVQSDDPRVPQLTLLIYGEIKPHNDQSSANDTAKEK